MKTSINLFFGLAVFYFIITAIYWQVGGEAVGITALFLSGALAALVGFYMWFAHKRIGGSLPEDRQEAEIADGAGELGFYSPHSWWPLPVALSACAAGLGLIIGWWLTFIGVGALLVSILGYVTEYEKPTTSSHH
ncbi:MAG TPA: cytochrome c oxidase subunit 4 [Candidatus Paceibacterota bacterium]|nr:cytochrome c oxidase subunit 4 [Candidatus Paceibacterota bacterium]